MKNQYETLKQIIKESHNIVVFTGAGISVPSGIPDFRSANGLYNQKDSSIYSPEQIISHSFYMKHKEDFYRFYKDKMVYPHALPNDAHKFIAELEKDKHVTVITQNIDGLHQEAGSKKVRELHGSIKRNYCMKCHKFYTLEELESSLKDGVPRCSCGGIIKPDVVLYEEPLDNDTMYEAVDDIRRADLLIVAGTSLVVYPAAGFIRYFNGDNIVVINLGRANKNAFYGLNKDILYIDGRVEEYLNIDNLNNLK